MMGVLIKKLNQNHLKKVEFVQSDRKAGSET